MQPQSAYSGPHHDRQTEDRDYAHTHDRPTAAWIDAQQHYDHSHPHPNSQSLHRPSDSSPLHPRHLTEMSSVPMSSSRIASLNTRLASAASQPTESRHAMDRSHSPSRSRSSAYRQSYSEHLRQQQHDSLLEGSPSAAHLAFPNTLSTSFQQLPFGVPSPSISRIGDPKPHLKEVEGMEGGEDDYHESTGLVLGHSKQRRGRNNSHSSYGSSVLPASYNPQAYRGFAAAAAAAAAADGGSYPSRQGIPAGAAQPQRYGNGSSRPSTGMGLNGGGPRPSASELEGWLRATNSVDAHAYLGVPTSPQMPDNNGSMFSSSGFHTFAPQGRITKKPSGMTLSDAGSARARGSAAAAPGSASGLSAGVMSAGAGDVRRRRKKSSRRRDVGGSSSIAALQASLGGPDAAVDPANRRIDSIEEWRAKSSGVNGAAVSGGPTVVGARPRKKSSATRRDSDLARSIGQAIAAIPPPLPTYPGMHTSRTLDSLSQLAGSSSLSPPAHQRRRSSKVPSVTPSLTRSILAGGKSMAASGSASASASAHLADLLALLGHRSQEDTPIRRFVRWISKEGLRSALMPTILLTVLVFKWSVGRGGWSGRGVAPTFGDFEAQRHWVELTLHLPTSQWYFHDLHYWGLDYPPLTAWLSLACGYVARSLPAVRPGFELYASRGDESPATVVFMRATVVFFDYAIYIPAVTLFLSRRLEGRGSRTHAIALLSILLQPCLILIDNGHFQYNSVMLGFAAACFALLYTTLPNPSAASSTRDLGRETSGKAGAAASGATAGSPGAVQGSGSKVTDLSRRLSYEYVLAALFFCLSLGFKQMALYYAPAVFAVMLGRCIGLLQVDPERGVSLFCGLGLCVIVTFGVLFSPWLTSVEQIGQIVHRIFPLARGLFEDKVANMWCFLSVLPIPQRYKLRNLLSVPATARLSMLSTLIMILPGCLMLYAAAAETAKREMMVDDRKMLEEAMAKSKARRLSVSSSVVTAADDKESSSVSPASPTAAVAAAGEMKRATSKANSRSRKSGGGRTSSISGSVAAGRAGGASSDIQSLLAVEGNRRAFPLASTSLRTHHTAVTADHPVASTLPSPAAMMLPYGLVSVSMAFFLFGFQVHEKSILLPLLPLTLLLGAKGDQWGGGSTASDWAWAVLSNNVGVFSMFPLLKRNGQMWQYATLVVAWNWMVGNRFWRVKRDDGLGQMFSALVHTSIIVLHLLDLFVPLCLPTLQVRIWSRYPDIYPVLNVLLATPVFLLIWLWATTRQWQVGFGCGLESWIWTGTATKQKVKSNKI